jgi:hypothetical protein
MKYTGYTKAELIEWCQCLEHNYNVEKERFERVSGIAQKEAIEIVELRRLLKECVPYVTFKVNIEKNIGCTPPGAYLLTCIKDALGESEER